MTAKRRRRPADPKVYVDGPTLARLRLRHIAEWSGRVDTMLAVVYFSPACAAGMFRMSAGWYVVAGFNGEAYWREYHLDELLARIGFDEMSMIVTKRSCA